MNGKVLLIYTGGTVGMFKNETTGALEAFDFSHLLKYVPELKQFDIQIDTIAYDPIDSSDIKPDFWVKLVTTIEENYEKYDGFVILHGTDTMAYSASALSFMIENLRKPVIFTGSQLPIGQIRTDGKENLITSIQIAADKKDGESIVQEVCIFFQSKLFRGNRARKFNAEYFDAFQSPNYPPLAEVGIDIKYNFFALRKNPTTQLVHFHKHINNNVFVVRLFPGIKKEYLESLFSVEGLRGLVFESYGAGNAITDKWFYELLEQAKNKKIAMVNVTQCNAGSVKQGLYETSLIFQKLQIPSGRDITTEAVVTKIMFLLGQNLHYDKINYYLSNNIAGEISI